MVLGVNSETTGRTEDILRVLGDPTKGVDMPSDDASALDALRQAGQDAGV